MAEARRLNRIATASLLLEARRTVLDRLLPTLPATEAYQARLVARALQLAANEVDMAPEAPASVEEARKLCDGIRSGAQDASPKLHAALLAEAIRVRDLFDR